MSHQQVSLNPDLKRLRDEGYEVEIKYGHLVIWHIPYVNSQKEIKYGALVSELTMAGDKTAKPGTHVALFSGERPCYTDGRHIDLGGGEATKTLGDGLVVDRSFSMKLANDYVDYYEKMTTYIKIIFAHAQAIDASVTPQTFKPIETKEDVSIFNYLDTNSSRAGINVISDKLKSYKIGIVGLGGTGSYVLDLIAKTPVREIHLFDGDNFYSHNAFRAPGAPSLEQLNKAPKKVNYLADHYLRMRKNIFPHDYYIDPSNVDQLSGMDFVFICLDKADIKGLIIDRLELAKKPFIDVGMGLEIVNDSLIGIVRTTSSTENKREHKRRIGLTDAENDVYSQNIQIADLNALNAALAVIKWKKLCGFYQDLEGEHHSTYSINVNQLLSEERG